MRPNSPERKLGAGDPVNTSDLFVMNADGSDPRFLIRGGSPTWSPDGKQIAFQASASGTGQPINGLPGAATEDSDIFVFNVDDRLEHGTAPRNLTNPDGHVDDRVDEDPDWSPDGTWIVYTSHDASQRPTPPALDYTSAELYKREADGTGTPTRLTFNSEPGSPNPEEERAPNWSHQGDRIAYMCHDHTGNPPSTRFEICVMNADGTNQRQLTDNNLGDLGNTWSPDDERIIFQRATPVTVGGRTFNRNELWWHTTAEDISDEHILVDSREPTGSTFIPDVGVLRVKTDN